MRVEVAFPRDSRDPKKGFKTEVVEVTAVELRECFEEAREAGRNRERFIDCVRQKICEELASRYVRSMGAAEESPLYEQYMLSQCEAMRENIEAAVKKWLIDMAELLKRCNRRRECIVAELERRW